jgi:hypothetical protein
MDNFFNNVFKILCEYVSAFLHQWLKFFFVSYISIKSSKLSWDGDLLCSIACVWHVHASLNEFNSRYIRSYEKNYLLILTITEQVKINTQNFFNFHF